MGKRQKQAAARGGRPSRPRPQGPIGAPRNRPIDTPSKGRLQLGMKGRQRGPREGKGEIPAAVGPLRVMAQHKGRPPRKSLGLSPKKAGRSHLKA